VDCYVEEVISKNRPAAIVFNLLDYQYVFGNDVTALFTAAYDRDTKKPRPVYIAATGTTHRSLRNLFNGARIQQVFRVEFVDNTEDAVQRLGGDDSARPGAFRRGLKDRVAPESLA
jgi:hypothetical protein